MGFVRRRIRRIYPPYFFALLFFLVTRLIKVLESHGNQFSTWSFLQYIQNFSLTQWLTILVHPNSVAYKNPTLMVVSFWTLNYEEQFYLVMALMLMLTSIWYRIRLVNLVACLGLIGAVWIIAFGSLCYGLFIDYWVVFAIGSLVYWRLTRLQTMFAQRVVDMSMMVLVVVFSIFTYSHPSDSDAVLISGGGRAVYAELLLAISFGLVLIYTRPLNSWINNSKVGIALRGLGKISYSLYLVNQFNLTLVSTAARFLLPAAAPGLLKNAVVIALHILIGTIFWFFCERPFLNKPIIEAVDQGKVASEEGVFCALVNPPNPN